MLKYNSYGTAGIRKEASNRVQKKLLSYDKIRGDFEVVWLTKVYGSATQ